MSEGHTKTPWHIHDCEPYQETSVFKSGRTVVGGDGSDQAVAYCDYITPQIAKANASLIVTAVNSHSALMKCAEALRRALPFIDDALDVHMVMSETCLTDECRKAVADSNAALSLLDEVSNGK